MRKFIPVLQWLPKYKASYLSGDIIAGITVSVVLIPQAMAYAMIAGLPPVYGLYAAVFPILVYAMLGTSRALGVGPAAIDSLLVAVGLGGLAIAGQEEYFLTAIFLAFMVGAFQLLLGLFRMGFLVNFLSRPVLSGFTTAAALIIIFSQLKNLFGTEISQSTRFHEMVYYSLQQLSSIHLPDFLIGVGGIALMLVMRRFWRRFPGILLVVVLAITAVYFMDLEAAGIGIVGTVPSGLPNFNLHSFDWEKAVQLWPIALTLALIGYLEAISIGKSIEDKSGEDKVDPNQELVALGLANILGSFFKSYPVAASFSRSAIMDNSGSRTNLAGVFTLLMVVITLLFLTPVFYFLPKAVLAGIIMVSVYGLMDITYPQTLWKGRRDEFFVWALTFLTTLFFGIIQGILTGALLAMLLMIYRSSKPHIAVLGRINGTDYYKNVDRFADDISQRSDMLILRFDAQLYFGNASYFKRRLFKLVNRKGGDLKAVILNAEAINYIDSSASHKLIAVITELQDRGIDFYLVGAIGPARDIIFNSGIIEVLKRENLFVRIDEAVAYHDKVAQSSQLREKVAYQRNKRG